MSTQVTLASTLAWLTDPTQPGGPSIVNGTRRPSAATDTTDGEFLQFAGFRGELAAYDSSLSVIPLVFPGVNAAQLAQLTAWRGRTLLLRTVEGGRWYGGFLAVARTIYLLAGPLWDAEITFQVTSTAQDTV